MFEDRTYTRTFYSAPQSVTSFVAAFLEPAITVGCFLAVLDYHDLPVDGAAMTLCLLVFALSFPGRNRFKDPKLTAIVDISTSWASLLAILALCGYATRSLDLFDEEVLIAWAVLTPVVQLAAVVVGREIVKMHARRPEARRSAIVVGAGPLGVKVSRALQGHEGFGIDFVGFFDDRTDMRVHPDASDKVLGRLGEVSSYVMQHGIKEVYITLPLTTQPRIKALLESLQETTASLFFVPDVFGISIIQGRLQDVNGVPVVGILETPFTGTNALVKRITDIVLSTLILVLISPLMLLIAIGVKLSSPGPVIFKQKRNGLDGEEITVYKFRTMRTMDNGPVIKQATRDDPRVTRFGAFLRRTSLDELPQFFNVLQGRMSIVGPRPHAVAHNEQYRKMIKAYMVRHKVKPGITGWAQVNGHRGETDTIEKMEARVEYDLEYLRNWSLGLDLLIIARTARLMLFDRHAY
ncbi:undecaprenyl-phosphate glucose phosphotransferase [Caldimonas thermodepolymerans]|jgi:putative colanic acid biosynthesis UDP-glucose lipid carrier transferase|uniref:Colanic acid biosynthesis UDP-glucose lipid carrier transferase n=1 Tax=Caldimonas thermodepolymerans TaxID=215580 RepID=A0AA46DDK4_9BURK|nr:undecaprenyl-phosphate glucose phosphotransferase [Caldimonas thermodepolymerans]TCP06346.1 putative colanic acid biosynthesis UDP-glucose lipid carrier transferase [Caldimonas thermodepolymerans]UZG49103.1 undecaprenyl-phosphate glucose phosphotransferase [Caldimonas thermodepolymerans]